MTTGGERRLSSETTIAPPAGTSTAAADQFTSEKVNK
jgi:hypothetical protein